MMNLFSNLLSNIIYLKSDFIGFKMLPESIENFAINSIISLSILLLYYLIGGKITKIFFKDIGKDLALFTDFVYFAVGYIFTGSIFLILGIFSILYRENILLVLFLLTLIAVFPLNKTKKNLIKLKDNLKFNLKEFRKHKLIFFLTLLFILASFFKLLSPEIREDQYHTDFPLIYLQEHSVMIPKGEPLRALQSPQLTEMTYLVTIFVGHKEASRFISFIFYILIIFVFFNISKFTKYKLPLYSVLIFVATPLVIRLAATQYVELQFIFCFLLSVVALTFGRELNNKRVILSAILFGGVLATKLWTITFLPVFLVYLLFKNRKNPKNLLNTILLFTFFAILISSFWYLRSYILTGDFFYPAFSKDINLENTYTDSGISKFFGLNYRALEIANLKELGILFLLGIFSLILNVKDIIKKITNTKILWFTIIFLTEYCFIQYYLGRYLLGIYPFLILISSVGIYYCVNKFKLLKYLFILITVVLAGYYLVTSLVTLPYGLKLADNNAYLTRVLARDNTSYYDYNHLFGRYFNKNDLVGIHDLYSFYYADFKYLDDNYIFNTKVRRFSDFKEKGITKFIIKGGDMEWFCKKHLILGCDSKKYELLSKFSERLIYLYKIN